MKDTILSLIRHVATFVGGYLLSKGIVGDAIAAWLPGAIFILGGSVWGSVDEYLATRKVRNLVLSLVRHILTTAGGYFSALGKISIEHIETIIGAIMAVAGALWGADDEYTYAQEHPPSDAK